MSTHTRTSTFVRAIVAQRAVRSGETVADVLARRGLTDGQAATAIVLALADIADELAGIRLALAGVAR